MRSVLLLMPLTGCLIASPPAAVDAAEEADAGSLDSGTIDSGCQSPTPSSPDEVSTSLGVVRGGLVLDGGVRAFRGIPFATPPVGDLRFRPPEPAQCWSGVRTATAPGAACLQAGSLLDGGTEIRGEEDCLTLNVWRPVPDASPRPVLVYIHGGGNQSGSASEVRSGTLFFDGAPLASAYGVVVVTLQYRLGPLGFLTRASLQTDAGVGNYGILDQQLALRWVRDNAAHFGGDPQHVMLFGESAGALNTCTHLASPGSAGLFQSAVVESGACLGATTAYRFNQGLDTVKRAGCEGVADEASCLRQASATAMLEGLDPVFSGGVAAPVWGATIDGVTLKEAPLDAIAAGRGNRVPLIVGSNADESSLTAPVAVTPAQVDAIMLRFPEPQRTQLKALYPSGTTNAEARRSFIAIATDAQFTCNARRLARAQEGWAPVFRYFFDHALPGNQGALLGAFHGVELFYVFRTLDQSVFAGAVRPSDRAVTEFVSGSWTSLATNGDPNGGGRPLWPRSNHDDAVMRITPASMGDHGIANAECDVWDQLVVAP